MTHDDARIHQRSTCDAPRIHDPVSTDPSSWLVGADPYRDPSRIHNVEPT